MTVLANMNRLFLYKLPTTPLLSCTHDDNGLITITKSKGDNGHPCLVPLVKEKKSEKAPLVMTAALGLL